jgi:ABC-type transporter Mla subunit MlaD
MTVLPPDAIAELAKQLIASAYDRDWTAVAQYNQQADQLASSLRTAFGHSLERAPSALRAAVTELQMAHQQTRVILEQDTGKLAERIANLRDNREGLRAYEQAEGQA